MEILFKEEVYEILGACFEVYKEKGSGFLEAVYQECLEIELNSREIPFVSQTPLSMRYKNNILKQKYIPDFLCYDKIIIELKAHKVLADEHRAQLMNYLKATSTRLGLLVNFGHYPQLEYQRIIM